MSWVSILHKNNKDFDTKVDEVDEVKDVIVIDIVDCDYYDNNIKNYDDEFDIKYSTIMVDIKIDFMDYINDLSLPFLDNNLKTLDINEINFYDFIKNNCENYNKVVKDVDKNNKEYIKEMENEEDEIIYDKKFLAFNCC